MAETVKRHIYISRPFILAYNQVTMTFCSKVLFRTRKRWQTDRRTSQAYRTLTLGSGPNNRPYSIGYGHKYCKYQTVNIILYGCSMIGCTYNFYLCYRDFQGRNSFDLVNFIIAVIRYAGSVYVPERIIKIDRRLT